MCTSQKPQLWPARLLEEGWGASSVAYNQIWGLHRTKQKTKKKWEDSECPTLNNATHKTNKFRFVNYEFWYSKIPGGNYDA